MRLLPYERLTLRSDDPPDIVQSKLATLVTTRRFYLERQPQPFRGAVQQRHFKVVRASRIRLGQDHSLHPVIIGDIAPAPSGTKIQVRMRLALLDAVGLSVWFVAVLGGAAYMAFRQTVSGAGSVGVVVVALIGYIGTSLTFWSEVKKARAALCEGLGCRVDERANPLVR